MKDQNDYQYFFTMFLIIFGAPLLGLFFNSLIFPVKAKAIGLIIGKFIEGVLL